MSFLDKFKKQREIKDNSDDKQHKQIGLEIKLPGCEEFVPIGKSQYKQIYKDDIGPRLLIVADECAELLEASGVKTEEGKEEDALKAEMDGLIKSITQLGRSSGIHMILATQRNDARIISGTIQNNPLDINTKLKVLRKM